MILVRTPFRISLVGGGSDLPSFYRHRDGAVVTTTINKYMYVALHPYFHQKIRVKYSQTEDVDTVDEIRHPIVRECLRLVEVGPGMEIASFADVPAGTGLGSSSTFAVCLLHLLHALKNKPIPPDELAHQACRIELDVLREPIGKQDQYAAAYGGANCIQFHRDDTVTVEPLASDALALNELDARLLLFYVGNERSASEILRDQSANMEYAPFVERVGRMVDLVWELRDVLIAGRIDEVGPILDRNWELKRSLAAGITNSAIDQAYVRALQAGASGGKILGAGGGGFLLIFCEPSRQDYVRYALRELRELPFQMTNEGSRVLFDDRSIESVTSYAREFLRT